MSSLRTAFAGSPEFAKTILSGLVDSNFPPVLVMTQPDKPKGRGRKLQPNPVKAEAERCNIPLIQPASLRDAETHTLLRRLELDVLVVAAYGLILPEALLSIPTYGCLNVHASLLPRWRGAAPIERAIMAGDSETGVAIMQMEKGLDTGPVFVQKAVPITEESTAGRLQQALAQLGTQLLVDVLNALPTTPTPQPADGVCYAAKLTAEDRPINWGRPAREIAQKIRALTERMPATCRSDTLEMQVLSGYALKEPASGPPGTVAGRDKRSIRINSGEGQLAITRLRLNRGKGLPMNAPAAVNGFGELFALGQSFADAGR